MDILERIDEIWGSKEPLKEIGNQITKALKKEGLDFKIGEITDMQVDVINTKDKGYVSYNIKLKLLDFSGKVRIERRNIKLKGEGIDSKILADFAKDVKSAYDVKG